MQKTSFPFEIVISDDCSKDNTRAVIAEYKAKFPNLFRDVSPESNMGAIKNFIHVQMHAKGQYIALCEGDDFWIDPFKLQKQVDFMESHPDFVACFHNARVFNGISYRLFNDVNENHYPSPEDIIIRRWFIDTPTLMYRNIIKEYPEWANMVVNGDYLLELLLARKGKFYYMDDVMAVYRQQGQGVSATMLNANKIKMYDGLIFLLANMKVFYAGEYADAFDQSIANYQRMKADYQKDLFYESHPLLKAFRPKTYKRVIKMWFRKYV